MDLKERSLEEIFGTYLEGGGERTSRRAPFKFLDPYEAEDTEIFFGREIEKKELFRKYHASDLLLLYGESGTGKTSLLRCGLLSQIPSSDILILHLKNSVRPFDGLQREISALLQEGDDEKKPILDLLKELYRRKRKPLTLIFDQFEELFIFESEDTRERLVREVVEWLESDLDIRVVFVIREEYLARLTEFEEALPNLFKNRLWIRKMDVSQAEEAIAGPCGVCGVEIERALIHKLLGHLQAEKRGIELPDLQVLMDRLYKQAVERDPESPRITLGDYEKLGRLENILAQFLEERIQELDDPELGKTILKLMVTAEGTKKAVGPEEIAMALTGQVKEKPAAYLQGFEKARILRQKADGTYELRHDSLAKTIYSWMSETEKELVDIRQLIENRYSEYKRRGSVLDDEALRLIEPYLGKIGLSPEIRTFVQESQKRRQMRIRRRKIFWAACISAAFLVLALFSYWNIMERRDAMANFFIAKAETSTDPYHSLAYLTASLENADLLDGRTNARKKLVTEQGKLLVPNIRIPLQYENYKTAELGPNHIVIVGGGTSPEVAILSLIDGTMLRFPFQPEHKYNVVKDLVVSPDHNRIAISMGSLSMAIPATIMLWDYGKNEVIWQLDTSVPEFAFSSDSKELIIRQAGLINVVHMGDLSVKSVIIPGHNKDNVGMGGPLAVEGRMVATGEGDALFTMRLDTLELNRIKSNKPFKKIMLSPGATSLLIEYGEHTWWGPQSNSFIVAYNLETDSFAGPYFPERAIHQWQVGHAGKEVLLVCDEDRRLATYDIEQGEFNLQSVSSVHDSIYADKDQWIVTYDGKGVIELSDRWGNAQQLWPAVPNIKSAHYLDAWKAIVAFASDQIIFWNIDNPFQYDYQDACISRDGLVIARRQGRQIHVGKLNELNVQAKVSCSDYAKYVLSEDGQYLGIANSDTEVFIANLIKNEISKYKLPKISNEEKGIIESLDSQGKGDLSESEAYKKIGIMFENCNVFVLDYDYGFNQSRKAIINPKTPNSSIFNNRGDNLAISTDCTEFVCGGNAYDMTGEKIEWKYGKTWTVDVAYSGKSNQFAMLCREKGLILVDRTTYQPRIIDISESVHVNSTLSFIRNMPVAVVLAKFEEAILWIEYDTNKVQRIEPPNGFSAFSGLNRQNISDDGRYISTGLKVPSGEIETFCVLDTTTKEMRLLNLLNATEEPFMCVDGKAIIAIKGKNVEIIRDSSAEFPGHTGAVWLLDDSYSSNELQRAILKRTNLRYDDNLKCIKPLPFAGIPQGWVDGIQ